ncbi:hypothetical protein Calkr_0011 [Caldicellulosiruptor acetigenus I77R1B]|uniref:Uncharacterized protein n=2 Tax=Caldicellulosiruptor acetigenus TaxID=301953 RepID=E4S5E0_CALA7|nr:hypothetical protein Calkr_0011 [Caldicellulosiruptor acetigenus I77R1B]
MRKIIIYIFAGLVILYQIIFLTWCVFNKESMSLGGYLIFALSGIGILALISLLNSIFSRSKFTSILTFNIFISATTYLIMQIISYFYEPLIFTDGVKERLLLEAKKKGIEISLGISVGSIISSVMILSLIIALITFIGYSVGKLIRRDKKSK